jgi:GDP-L-fucose synthase
MGNYNDSEMVNIGTGKDLTIKELAEIIKTETEFTGEIEWDISKPDGTPRKLLNVSKLNSLGWKFKIDLKTGIKNTYNWYRNSL